MELSEFYRKQAAELIKKAERLTDEAHRQSENAPGSFVTGASGRTRAQNRKTDRALAKTIKNAKLSIELRRKAALLNDKAWRIENREYLVEKERKEKEAKQAIEAKEKAFVKSIPLINSPSATLHITSKEYTAIRKDYRGISICGNYKQRTAMHQMALHPVFLTDKPIKEKP